MPLVIVIKQFQKQHNMGDGKKIIVVGSIIIAGFSIWAYTQYEKLMDYAFGFKKAKARSVSAKKISFDLYLTYVNKSDITFYLTKQRYIVYFNDVEVSRMSNDSTNIIQHGIDPATNKPYENQIGINVDFDPSVVLKSLNKNWASILLTPDKFIIRVDMKLTVGIKILGFIVPVTVPYSYPVSLKEVLSWYNINLKV